jgi:hypothetical protein
LRYFTYIFALARVKPRAEIVQDDILHCFNQVHKFYQLACGVKSELAQPNVIHARLRKTHARSREVFVEIEAIEPPSIQSSTKPLGFVFTEIPAIFRLVKPSHLGKSVLPSLYKQTIA